MEYLSLVFLHVLFGILWAGGAITAGLVVIPSVMDAGPAGGAVMGGVMKRRFPLMMTTAGVIVVLTGVRMYMVRFTADWLVSAEGLVLTLGAILGLGAFVLGVFVQKPTAQRLGVQIASSGALPSPEQAKELQALRLKLQRVARLTAWHLLGASTLMALHRLATVKLP